ncbi:MAG: hypothetical protein R6V85_09860 [Polyangia bacterium]
MRIRPSQLAVGAGALLVVVSAVLFAVFVYPWVELPDDPPERIQARWRRALRIAEKGPVCGEKGAELLRALERIEPVAFELDDLVSAKRGVPKLEHGDLPPAAAAALDELVAWSEGEAGMPLAAPCAEAIDAIAALRLGQIALAVGGGPGGAGESRAALRLASGLRECGALLTAMVGTRLADLALEQHLEHDAPSIELLLQGRPSAEEVLPVVARELVCNVRMLRAAGADEQGPLRRELLWMEKLYSDALLAAAEHPEDLDALAEAVDWSDQELPRSSLIDGLMPSVMKVQILEMRNVIRGYDELAASAP